MLRVAMINLQYVEECLGRDHLNPEAFRRREVLSVVGDDIGCPGGDGKLQDHVVFGVGQARPPEVEDLLLVSDRAKELKDGENLVLAQARGAQQHILILQYQRHRDANLEPPFP
jgi:hypothetical protein